MKIMAWTVGLALCLLGSSVFAESDSGKGQGKSKKKQKCVEPAPKYGGQCDKGNNGHGNNADDVDTSNPGKSKQGQDTDPGVDDETKPDK